MLTMEPVVAPGGKSIEGNSMRWALSPRRIYCRRVYKLEVRINRNTRLTAIPASANEYIRHRYGRRWGYVPSFPTVKVKLSAAVMVSGRVQLRFPRRALAMLDDWTTNILHHDPMRLYRAKRDAARRTVSSKYNIIGFISSGTYGRVYKAQSVEDANRIHAIKKFKPDKEGDVATYTGISQSAIREIAVSPPSCPLRCTAPTTDSSTVKSIMRTSSPSMR